MAVIGGTARCDGGTGSAPPAGTYGVVVQVSRGCSAVHYGKLALTVNVKRSHTALTSRVTGPAADGGLTAST